MVSLYRPALHGQTLSLLESFLAQNFTGKLREAGKRLLVAIGGGDNAAAKRAAPRLFTRLYLMSQNEEKHGNVAQSEQRSLLLHN